MSDVNERLLRLEEDRDPNDAAGSLPQRRTPACTTPASPRDDSSSEPGRAGRCASYFKPCGEVQSDRIGCDTLHVLTALRDELGRLASYEERHRRLLGRLALIVMATALVDVLGSIAMYGFERGARGTEVKTFGQAVFFTTVQLLTVSSQIRNPLTTAGRVVDIALEVWAVVVVAGSAGAVATFFQSADSREHR
jgi:hypothetical protein